MKKYTTKPIDFTGCHPVIAEHLKRGEAIECIVYDSPSCEYKRCWVLAYYVGNKYPYRTGEEAFRYAEPIPRKVKCIMPPERAIPALITNGWKYNGSGEMYSPAGFKKITLGMYQHMGSELPDHSFGYGWPDCIIEEVDE